MITGCRMPDVMRYESYSMNNRVSRPSITLDGDNQSNTSWNNAIETFAEVLEANDPQDIAIIGSPHASVEENYAFNKFFNLLGASNAKFTPHVVPGSGDDFLITDDQATKYQRLSRYQILMKLMCQDIASTVSECQRW
ncbi:MAG: hypothetical protein U5J63_02855 [Fodinibius sp.]|nr:hypothetical protein [Fodinibius sp.]